MLYTDGILSLTLTMLVGKPNVEPELTARTRKGITSIMMSVDFTPIALKNPTDPRTESITSITPERPRSTWSFNSNAIKRNIR